MNAAFLAQNALLGVGLAMDAFSVSLANGLREPRMRGKRMLLIAGAYGLFQYLMPMIGWFLVHTLAELFSVIERFIPWAAFLLLGWIGGKMLWEGLRKDGGEEADDGAALLTPQLLLVQALATSIDALSVGLTIERYGFGEANLACGIIGLVTLVICLGGLALGKRVGTKLSRNASVLGGVILIAIGFKILLEGLS